MRIKSFEIKGNSILGDISLDFSIGNMVSEKIIIAGENGLGKSTLLNILIEVVYLEFNYNSLEKLGGGDIRVVYSFSEVESEKLFKKFNLTSLDSNKIEILGEYIKTKWNFGLVVDGKEVLRFTPEEFGSSKFGIRNHFNFIFIEDIKRNEFSTSGDGGRFFKSSGRQPENLNALVKILFTEDINKVSNFLDVQNYADLQAMKWKVDRLISAVSKMIISKRVYKNVTNTSIEYEYNDKKIPLESMSSGEKNLIYLGATLIYKEDITSNSIIFLEEPETSLHPNWQKNILEFIKEVSIGDSGCNQIIATTHSPIILENNKGSNAKNVIFKHGMGELLIDCHDSDKDIDFSMEAFMFNIKSHKKTSIITEGKTDWKHLKAALEYFQSRGEMTELEVEFYEFEEDMGEDKLEKSLILMGQLEKQNHKIIGIFDSDSTIGRKYKDVFKFGNNVFALALPTPLHRKYHEGICIELLYKDDDLRKKVNGKRIYLSSEFNEKSIRLLSNNLIVCKNRKYLGQGKTEKRLETVVSDGVIDVNGNELALSKNEFATLVLNKKFPFDTMDFEGFRGIFALLKRIEKQ